MYEVHLSSSVRYREFHVLYGDEVCNDEVGIVAGNE